MIGSKSQATPLYDFFGGRPERFAARDLSVARHEMVI
jgi:hypothetical protein